MDGNGNSKKDVETGSTPNNQQTFPAEVISKLPATAKLETTLYDLADTALRNRSQLTGESKDQTSIYHELNRIMSINGYPDAHLGNRAHVSDKNLPSAWNSVAAGQTFQLYDGSKSLHPSGNGKDVISPEASAVREKLRKQILDETSTVPLLPGEGYFQVLKRMHPALEDEKVSTEAHRIKAINKHRDILKVGERLPTATEEERERELQRRLRSAPGELPTPPDSKRHDPVDKPTPPKDGRKDPTKPAYPVEPAPPVVPVAPLSPVPPEKTVAPTAPANAAEISIDTAYAALRAKYEHMQTDWTKETQSQGFIGQTFDAAKNHIGSSGEGRGWYDPRRIWSGLFDSDVGSHAVRDRLIDEGRQLDSLKQAVDAHDASKFRAGYKELTGVDFNASQNQVANLKGDKLVAAYDQSQRAGVDTSTDIAAGLAAVVSMRFKGASTLGTMAKATAAGGLLGGTAKASLMGLDGKYSNAPRDFAMGAVMGGLVPLSELGGSQMSRFAGNKMGLTVSGDFLTSRIETQGVSLQVRLLSAGLKAGTGGAIFGAIESPTREIVTDVQEGKEIKPLELGKLTVKGAAIGFVGGTILGGLSDRVVDSVHVAFPGKVVMPRTTIGGVEVPESGVVGLEDASKILKVKPEEFLEKATKDPYGAVKDAVKLHEQHGLNIQKVDPITGKPTIPPQFSDALTTVQNVELLTENSDVQLAKKVEIVQAADAYLKSNPSAIEDPLKRLTNDSEYKKVIQLKGQAGQEGATAFAQQFSQDFAKDLKTSMAVERVKDGSLSEADALAMSTKETEAAYKQKAADFFKDMTDPAQRQRLNTLVDGIYDKFNPEIVSKEQLKGILDAVPEKDRALAIALLQESAGSSSDTVLTARLKSLKSDIASQVGSATPDSVYTLAPNSSGNLLGYLYRKSNSMSMGMQNIDALVARVQRGDIPQSIVLFDDISSTKISQATREALKKIPKVVVVDVGAFEKGLNIIDFSKGPQAVSTKLNGLLDEARTIKAQNGKLLPTAVARQTLSGAVDDAAAALGPNVKVIRPTANLNIKYNTAADLVPTGVANESAQVAASNASEAVALPSAAASVNDETVDDLYFKLNVPKTSKAEIAGFLSGYAGQQRELAAQMIADGAVHNSFPVMVQKAVALHDGLSQMLESKGVNMKDVVMVSDKDPGGSSHLVTYLFGSTNGLTEGNFVSSRQLQQLVDSGAAHNKVLAYFDDTIYSGSQTTSMLNQNIASLSPFKRVVVAGLGAYEQGVDNIRSTHLAKIGKLDVATPSTHYPFYSHQNPFYSKLPSLQRNMVKTIGGAEGFGSIQGSLIWPYMYPDNNLQFFGSQFSGNVLHLAGP